MAKRANLKPPGKCIWCGGPDLSKEHIWSKWTHALVPTILDGMHTRTATISSPTHPVKVIEETKDRPGSTNTIRLRVVCQRCNSGWMSAIDEAAKPILTPLIGGHPFVITRSAQKIMATWIAMKAMVAEHSRPQDISTPQSERDHIRISRAPPLNWNVWIAKHDGSVKWKTGYARHSQTMTWAGSGPPPVRIDGTFAKNTQSATLGIGHLLFQVISTDVPGLVFDVPLEFQSRLWKIWPMVSDFLWPPGYILTETGVDSIAYAFDRLANEPRVRRVG